MYIITVLLLLLSTESGNGIIGRWEGESICVKMESNRACNDEVVRYDFTNSGGGVVHLNAQKMVSGKFETMGEMDFTYDETEHRWSSEFHTRSGRKGVWSFEVHGDAMKGTCVLFPEKIVVRNASAHRVRVE